MVPKKHTKRVFYYEESKLTYIECTPTEVACFDQNGLLCKCIQVVATIIDTCVYTCMAFEVECVVKSFSTESTEISFGVTVTFEVAVQQTLKSKLLPTKLAHELRALMVDWKLKK